MIFGLKGSRTKVVVYWAVVVSVCGKENVGCF